MARTRAAGTSAAAMVLALTAVTAGGCGGGPDGAAGDSAAVAIDVDHADTLADQAVRLRITGLAPGAEVTVTSQASDHRAESWQAHATFVADPQGTVDLSTTAPRSGSYQGVDGMGLFWAMEPPAGGGGAVFAPKFPQLQHSYQVRLTVDGGGRKQAVRVLERRWLGDGVTARELTPASDGIAGELFLPAAGANRRPAVLVFGGSEGGTGQNFTAALLASHGYPALALGYFGLPGLPATLQDIRLEYFAAAARLLATQPGVDPARILAMGYSRGSEAALLLADDYPSLVHGAVVYSPSAQVNPGFPSGPTAWTLDGKPVPSGTIPLDRVDGPLLAIAGADDGIWPSADWAGRIAAAPGLPRDGNQHRAIVYPAAGHLVGTFPYLAAGTTLAGAGTGQSQNFGGTRAGNAAAQAAGWAQVLALLDGLHGN
ncbi:acyl-CoA thioesterase/bile acid-CoA:amino acid N-acyltransferase family protein [Kitasatospora indigofera]|uniref:acyl-CoA thioesterase/bile acid-CoA:amino acid N-acyltransferase family protein n=1 Tax=Kitasatospora indigofera TaxID=67307 RepID=UPI00324D7DEC